jgi:hypothetical protein
VQAVTARIAATARAKEPCRFTRDRLVFFISEVASACGGENVMAGNTDICNLHVLVDHPARIYRHGREYGARPHA